MIRTQIILEENQHQKLTEIARKQNRSLSDLVREFLDEQLAAYKQSQLKKAAESLQADYSAPSELTALSSLNGEAANEEG